MLAVVVVVVVVIDSINSSSSSSSSNVRQSISGNSVSVQAHSGAEPQAGGDAAVSQVSAQPQQLGGEQGAVQRGGLQGEGRIQC